MVLYEYEGKALLKKYSLPMPPSLLISREMADIEERISDFIQNYGDEVVIKAQITAGHRGKRGLVRFGKGLTDILEGINALFSREDIPEGPIRRILIEKKMSIKREFYAGILYDRIKKAILVMFSPMGGVDIEELASNRPDAIAKIFIAPDEPNFPYKFYEAAVSAFNNVSMDVESPEIVKITEMLNKLVSIFRKEDMLLIEINPLGLCDGGLFVLDAKVSPDMNAAYRHPEWKDWVSLEEGLSEYEMIAKSKGIAYVQLEGNIGTISCGAGLSMATCDLIKDYGGAPANFLDIGGGASPEKVSAALEILLSQPSIKGILINVFGGITRCDEVATGIVEAFDKFNPSIPVVVRLIGTNDVKGVRILKEKNISAFTDMEEAVKEIVALMRRSS